MTGVSILANFGQMWRSRSIDYCSIFLPTTVFMNKRTIQLTELPIDQLQEDPDNPRDVLKDKSDDVSRTRLLRSIEKLGVENPLVVCAMKMEGRYLIIDGHRRYRCAKELKMESVPCQVYPKLSPSELAYRRFEVQNNRVEWGPLERAEAFAQIKRAEGFEKDKDLAGYLGLSPALVSASLKMLNQHTHYKELFEKYELPETYAIEFGRMRDFIRDIKEFDTRTIIEILLKKAKHRLIKNAKSFRIIGKIFMKANRYEEQLYDFLKDEDLTTEDLKEQTGETWLALMLEKVHQALAKRYSSGKGLTPEEEALCLELQGFLITMNQHKTHVHSSSKGVSPRKSKVLSAAAV